MGSRLCLLIVKTRHVGSIFPSTISYVWLNSDMAARERFFFFVDRFVPIRVLTFLFDGIKLGEGKAIDSAFLQFFLGVAPIFWGVQNQNFEIGSCHSLKRF